MQVPVLGLGEEGPDLYGVDDAGGSVYMLRPTSVGVLEATPWVWSLSLSALPLH